MFTFKQNVHKSEGVTNTEKWKLILKVIAFNYISIAVIFAVACHIYGRNELIGELRGTQPQYFDWVFRAFFWKSIFGAPAPEEIFWRLIPCIILTQSCWRYKRYDISKILAWVTLIAGTVYWTTMHNGFHIGVFAAGMSWGWLNMKTRVSWPWPSLVCHITANLSLYILVKFLQYFGYIAPGIYRNSF